MIREEVDNQVRAQLKEKFGTDRYQLSILQGGVSSTVYLLIDTVTLEKKVIKFGRNPKVTKAEVLFLEYANSIGVNTLLPTLLEGEADSVIFLQLPFCDAPTLNTLSYEEFTNKHLPELFGQILAKLAQRPVGSGFGLIEERRDETFFGSHTTFEDRVIDRILPRIENAATLFGLSLDSEKLALNLTKMIEGHYLNFFHKDQSFLMNVDLQPGNVFDTSPPTMFDPNPLLIYPAYALAASRIHFIRIYGINNAEAAFSKMVQSYRAEGKQYSHLETETVIRAASVLRLLEKADTVQRHTERDVAKDVITVALNELKVLKQTYPGLI